MGSGDPLCCAVATGFGALRVVRSWLSGSDSLEGVEHTTLGGNGDGWCHIDRRIVAYCEIEGPK